MYKKLLVLFIIFLFAQNIYCLREKRKIIEGILINTEDFSFEGNSFLKITDKDNNIIGYYEKYETKTILILNLSSVKIYNSNKELICTMIPILDGNRFVINLKNKEGKISKINLVQDMGEFKISGGYFDKDYELYSVIDMHMDNSREIYNNIFLKDKKIIYQEIKYRLKGDVEKKTIINENFYKENLDDALILTVLFKTVNEFRGMQ